MPVKKYISFEAAEKDLWVKEPDEKYYANLKALFEFWSKLNKGTVVKGITKLHSIEELRQKRQSEKQKQ